MCEFDCRSRIAATGVGDRPQCSVKCADTDLATELAKAIRAAWVDRLDWDELAQGALEFLSSTGRLIPAGGMALTAEQVEDVRKLSQMDPWWSAEHVEQVQARVRAMLPVAVHAGDDRCPEVNAMNDQCCFLLGHDGLHRACGYKWSTAPAGGMALTAEQAEDVRRVMTCGGGLAFEAARDRLRALFPATEPAEEAPCGFVTAGPKGLLRCNLSAGHEFYHDWTARADAPPAPAVPAEEEAKAEHNASVARREALGRVAQQLYEQSFDGCDGTFYHDFGRALEDFLPSQGWTRIPAVSPVVPAPTETEAGHA